MSITRDKLTAAGFFAAGAAVALILTFSNNWLPVSTGAEPKAEGAHGDRAVAAAPEKPVIDEKATELAESLSKAFEQVASAVSPAVVHIFTSKTVKRHGFEVPFDDEQNDLFKRLLPRFGVPREYQQQALGSGVIISTDGYILTNNHVVSEADQLKVTLSDKREFDAKVIGTDPQTEVALIRIDGKDFPTAVLGDSDKLSVGQWVVAIGNPFGFDRTVTQGIISAKSRRISDNRENYEDFIQTDAAINPGNSGGPLVNLRGEVIGINTAIYSRTGGYQGIGFAIPINMAKSIKDSLMTKGRVVRGFLGVQIQDIDDALGKVLDLKSREGSLVSSVVEDSAAAKAGIERGDVIVKFDGIKVTGSDRLRNIVASTPVGKEVKVEVNRKGKIETLTARIGDKSKDAPPTVGSAGEPAADFGFSVESITSDLRNEYGLKEKDGVVITQVTPNGLGDRKGLKPGTVIVEIRQQPVKNMGDFKKAMEAADPKKGLLMLVSQEGGNRYVVLKAE